MSDEMKKWMPYKSIVEQDGFLNKVLYEKGKKDRPIVLPDKQEEINEVLVNYAGQEVRISFYQDGYVYKVDTTIEKIDKDNKKIYLARTKFIEFKNIVDIESLN